MTRVHFWFATKKEADELLTSGRRIEADDGSPLHTLDAMKEATKRDGKIWSFEPADDWRSP